MSRPSRTFDCAGYSWDDVRHVLNSVLDLRRGDEFTVLASNHLHRFVQFADGVKPGTVRAETVSNNFLRTDDQLSRAVIRKLQTLGWRDPNRSVPNFWRTFRSDAHSAAADLAVQTMRDAFGVADPSSLRIDWDTFGTAIATTGGSILVPPPLEVGQDIENRSAGTKYSVKGLLGEGGFGAAYRVIQRGRGRKHPGKLCLKVAVQTEGWHREAYFGQLLQGFDRAVAVRESFATFLEYPGAGQVPLYCLVTELAANGDLISHLASRGKPWSEARAVREVKALLRVLLSLHNAGAVHRDLTPSNVFVTETERLKLGDFGIARHRVGGRDVTADAFNAGFAPESLVDGTARAWRAADDVYQMGVVLAMLLTGDTEAPPTAEDVKDSSISAPLKAILQRAIGTRHKRYRDAGEMLAALHVRGQASKSVRTPTSLKGKRVVFTGKLAGWTRRQATDLVRVAGGEVMPKITSATDVVVEGDLSRQWKADAKGQKLLDVDREAERGHHVAVISERQFMRLTVGRTPSAANHRRSEALQR